MHALLCAALLALGEKPTVELRDLSFLDLASRLRLEAELDRTTSEDPAWRFDDLQAARNTVSDDRNMALRIIAIRKVMPKDWPQWKGTKVPGSPEADRYDRIDYAYTLVQRLREHPEVRPGESELAVIQDAVKESVIGLDPVRDLTTFETGRYPLIRSGFLVTAKGLQEARELWSLLEYDAMLAAEAKDSLRLHRDVQAMLAIIRSFGDDGNAYSVLVRCSLSLMTCDVLERALAQVEFDESQLRSLQYSFQAEDAINLLPQHARSAQAEAELIFRSIEEGQWTDLQWNASISWLPNSWEEKVPPKVAVWSARKANFELTRQVLEWDRSSPTQWSQFPGATPSDIDHSSRLDIYSPAQFLMKTTRAIARREAHLRCAISSMAAERFRKANARWPKDLADLTPRYLKEVPSDPFLDRPLRFLPTADGLLIYSVGEDGNDDKGKRRYEEGEIPSQTASLDYGIRLWNAESRRQPQLPPRTGKR